MNTVTVDRVERERESYTLVNQSAVLFGSFTHQNNLVNNIININKNSLRTHIV